jgi:hypothetical protein
MLNNSFSFVFLRTCRKIAIGFEYGWRTLGTVESWTTSYCTADSVPSGHPGCRAYGKVEQPGALNENGAGIFKMGMK